MALWQKLWLLFTVISTVVTVLRVATILAVGEEPRDGGLRTLREGYVPKQGCGFVILSDLSPRFASGYPSAVFAPVAGVRSAAESAEHCS